MGIRRFLFATSHLHYTRIFQQGEGVPAAKLASTASHVEQIRNFVRRVNLTISARNESDIEESFIIKELNKHLNIVLSFANDIASQHSDNPVPPVGTFYDKPDPSKDINKDDREKFWNEVIYNKKINGLSKANICS